MCVSISLTSGTSPIFRHLDETALKSKILFRILHDWCTRLSVQVSLLSRSVPVRRLLHGHLTRCHKIVIHLLLVLVTRVRVRVQEIVGLLFGDRWLKMCLRRELLVPLGRWLPHHGVSLSLVVLLGRSVYRHKYFLNLFFGFHLGPILVEQVLVGRLIELVIFTSVTPFLTSSSCFEVQRIAGIFSLN